MEYKYSKFNTYQINKQYIIIFNSYSTNIIKIMKDSKLYKLVLEKQIDSTLKDIKKLINGGFIVEINEDEERKRNLHINDLVMNNKLVFTILTTGQCNFRCKYCYEKFTDEIISEEIQNAFINFVKNNIKNYAGIHLRWFGGEPLLALSAIRKISKEIKEICFLNKKEYSAEILTNGYLLDYDKFEELIQLGIKQFKITLDGPKKVHDSQRVLVNGEGTFDKIITNLKTIEKNAQGIDYRIILRTNISKNSLNSLEEFLELLKKEFGNNNNFTFKFKTVDILEGGDKEKIKELKIKNESDLFEKLINSKNKLNYDVYFDHLETGICRAGKRNNFVLGADGTIYKCLVYFEKEENKIGYFNKEGDMIINEAKLALWINNYECAKRM